MDLTMVMGNIYKWLFYRNELVSGIEFFVFLEWGVMVYFVVINNI